MLDDLPIDWSNLTTKQVASESGLQTGPFGSQLKASEYVDADGADVFFVVMPKDIVDNQIDFSTCAKIERSKADTLKRHWLEAGDVLFARRGDLSKVAVYEAAGIKAICGTGCLRLRPNQSIAVHRFLRAVITSHGAIEWLKAHAVGATMPNLNTEIIGKLPLRLPPLPEQERIAEVLTSVDDSIRATEAVIAQAERVKRGLMEDLLTGGFGIEAIARGEVPEGWRVRQLGELAEFQNGFAFKPKDWVQEGRPIIRIQNLNGGTDFNYYDKGLDERFLVKSGDLLFCWSGSRGTSFGARYWHGEDGWLNQHIFKCVPKQLVSKSYLYYLLDLMTEQIERDAHGGAGLVHIKKSEMVKFRYAVPNAQEQERLSSILSEADEMIASNKRVLDQLIMTKRGLMDDLLTGRVRTV
ncbi:restriction endonuclease subunit S [Stappia indica]|uniref:restriction endonuclease subunit S n=1 Tax=Stappia indica TaxID=538381 RepID=UPI001D18CC1A|nr:restriction endonuclease subunit S [Stappia indica]MCC4247302.1 restriction endonuclease subunit S [Stappia indica]